MVLIMDLCPSCLVWEGHKGNNMLRERNIFLWFFSILAKWCSVTLCISQERGVDLKQLAYMIIGPAKFKNL